MKVVLPAMLNTISLTWEERALFRLVKTLFILCEWNQRFSGSYDILCHVELLLRYTRLQQRSKGLHCELLNTVNISFTIALNIFTQVGYWNSRDGVVMDPRQPVIWLSGSVNVPKDTSTFVENTTIRVMTVIVSMKPCRAWKFYRILQTLSHEIMAHSLYEMRFQGIKVAVFIIFTGYLF